MNDKPKKKGKRVALIITSVVLGVLVLAGGFGLTSFASDNGPARLTLPDAPDVQLSDVDGQWRTTSGTVGYRAREKAFGIGHDVVGRTDQVTGEATTQNGAITEARVEVPLTGFIVNGKPHAATSDTVGASRQPTATFTTDAPIQVDGTGTAVEVTGSLAFNGQSQPVTWQVTPRATGPDELRLHGTTSIDVTQWGVTPPAEAGVFSIDKQVVLEFLTTWER